MLVLQISVIKYELQEYFEPFIYFIPWLTEVIMNLLEDHLRHIWWQYPSMDNANFGSTAFKNSNYLEKGDIEISLHAIRSISQISHLSHIQQCVIHNINVYIHALNGALQNMEHVHCGIYEDPMSRGRVSSSREYDLYLWVCSQNVMRGAIIKFAETEMLPFWLTFNHWEHR